MKTKLLLLSAVLQAVFLLFCSPDSSPAQEPLPAPAPARPDTAQLLREALFEEQGVRDLEKAATGYQKVIAAYDAERAFGATALYRLAELRRAQNKKDEASSLYQRLLTEFPTHDPLARLSRENLAALGVKEIPGADPAGADEQDARIAELKRMLKDSPDLVKDPKHNQPLWIAVEKGQTKVVNFLLEAGAKAEDGILEVAARDGHLSVCEALIANGADVNNSGALLRAVQEDRMEVARLCLEKGADLKMWPVLEHAVDRGRTEMVRLLLEKGADPNYRADREGKTDGALFSAVVSGNKEILDLLIQAKADPNLPPPARSPLYYAVRNGNVPVAKRLLAIGADVRVRCIDSLVPRLGGINQGGIAAQQVIDSERDQKEYTSTAAPVGWPLLHAAVLSDRLEMLDLLLPLIKNLEDPGHSGKQTALALAVGAKQVEMGEHLLKAGASAKVNGSDGLPLLFVAADNMDERLVKLLLAAGADASYVSTGGRTVLASLVRSGEKALPLIRLLLAAGVDPDSQDLKAATGGQAVQLAREFRYPKWAASGQVTLSLPESFGFSLPLATKGSAAQTVPPSLTDLMLEANFRWVNQPAPEWTTLRLFRRDQQGALQEQIIPDWLDGKAPVLQWGDIVEFVSADWQNPSMYQNVIYLENLPDQIQTRLRATLVRHVTVNLEGKTYPMTLRGALKVYNPLKLEAPLTDAVSVMKMMGAADLRWFNASVRVKRLPEQGGGEISSKMTGGAIIPLKEGDSLELTGEPVALERDENSIYIMNGTTLSSVADLQLLSPGLPFSRLIPSSSASAPTLIQFLAEAYPPPAPASLARLVEAEQSGSVLKLTGKTASQTLGDFDIQAVLPHPDWSQIKIRRIVGKNEFKEIPVDLAGAIAACTDATTPEEAKKSDLELMAGDAILLPIRQDLKDQPWTGWDAETLRFFSKALAIQVTLSDADGSFGALNLEYLPVRYVETAAGLLGLPAREPAPHLLTHFSTTALVAAVAPKKSYGHLQRTVSINPARMGNPIREWCWLRDKDFVSISKYPQPSQSNGKRVVLPTAPGQ